MLLPVGVQAWRRSRTEAGVALRPLACLPLGFALQQGLEGLIWTVLPSGPSSPWLAPLSVAYLFFAYALWPAWIPWSALVLAKQHVGRGRRIALRVLLGLGALLGLSLWLPVLAHPLRAVPSVMAGSLRYGAMDLLHGTPLAGLGPALYLLLITSPLLMVPSRPVRLFALSLGVSALISQLWWQHTFSSVWCFFSALLSWQILLLLDRNATLRPPEPPLPPPAVVAAS